MVNLTLEVYILTDVTTSLLVLNDVERFMYLSFLLWLEPYIDVLLGSNIGIVLVFMIILANSNGKNEFKIAWLVPVSIFPIFGVAMYCLYHTNGGGIKTKQRASLWFVRFRWKAQLR